MKEPQANESAAPVRARGPELFVATLLMVLAATIITDSLRVGTGWADDGPRSGYFPFYIGLLLLGASGTVLVGQLWRWRRDDAAFAERHQVGLVVAVLVPMVVYVGLIFPLGIYVASAALIGYFMRRYGKYRWRVTLPVAVGVPLLFFVVFERWFLVPLPKGPLERLFGL
ncbi:MAG: tripartite tricarboxylate transporter TctB family protein [Chitinophagaceae bacterium]|nr:tripartite tricarboxylate transporter TctB family protein [Rubrivivax sp.]